MARIPLYYNRRSLFVRKLTTGASILGIALVVFVFASVQMLSRGIERTLTSGGHPDNAIVLRKGSQAELVSGLDRETARIISLEPEIVTDEKGPLVSMEAVVLIVAQRRDGKGVSNITIRGVTARAAEVRADVRIVSGRMFEHGQREIIVGQKLGERFFGTRIGESLKLGREFFKVVGIFEAGGSAQESEAWGDADEVMASFQRPVFSSVLARLKPGALAAYKARVEGDQRLGSDVKAEVQYYLDLSKNLAAFVFYLGLFVAVVFSLGATIGAMITMFAAVAARGREIGTLRAIGFSAGSILLGFVTESALLALLGGAIGVALSAVMTLVSFSTMNFDSWAEVVFRFELSPRIAATSMLAALLIGVAGGFFPARRAARMKVVDAVRT